MAYKMDIDGMSELSQLLDKLEQQAPAVAAQALYEGAGEMMTGIRKEIAAIKTEPFKYAKNGEMRLPSPEEKAILEQAGVGVAKFDKNGTEVDTSVGFNQSGYADVSWNHMSSQARTNYKNVMGKYGEHYQSKFAKMIGVGKGAGNKKPIGVIANAINSGTSFMKKQPFFRKAVKNTTRAALDRMEKKIGDAFEQYIKDMSKI